METQVQSGGSAGETIGERLRRLRTERRLSQRELSEPGVSYAYISRIEANTRTPSVKALRKLARTLGVSPEYLETGSEIGPSEQRELRLDDAELELRLDSDPAAAEEALQRLLEESTQAGDLPSAMRAQIGLGLVAARRGDHSDAVSRLEGAIESGLARAEAVVTEAVADAEEIADPYTQVRLYWSLARLASLQGKPATALAHSRRAIALLEATEDTVHLARAHLLSGAILNLNGSPERASGHLDVAERLFGVRPDPDDLVSLRCEQARAAAQLGNGDEAVTRGREVLDLLGDENPAEQGNAWWAIAEGLALGDDNAGADEAFRRASDLLSGENRWREASQACRSWAKMLRKAGRENEALDVLERAADLAARRESTEVTAPS